MLGHSKKFSDFSECAPNSPIKHRAAASQRLGSKEICVLLMYHNKGIFISYTKISNEADEVNNTEQALSTAGSA